MYNNYVQRPKSRNNYSSKRPSTKYKNFEEAKKYFDLAKQHQCRKEYELAIKYYDESLKNDPDDYKCYCNLGTIYKIKGNLHEALNKYHRALLIKKDDYKTLYNLANLYRIIGNAQKAIGTYLIVLNACSDGYLEKQIQIDTYNNMGICYKNIRKYQQAISCYEKVIGHNDKDQIGYYNKGCCLMLLVKDMSQNFSMIKKSRLDEAQSMLQKSYQLNPNNNMVKICLIELQCLRNPQASILQESILKFSKFLQDTTISDFIKIQINWKIAECKKILQKIKPAPNSNNSPQKIPIIYQKPKQVIVPSNQSAISSTNILSDNQSNNIPNKNQPNNIQNGNEASNIKSENVTQTKQMIKKRQEESRLKRQKQYEQAKRLQLIENQKKFLQGKPTFDKLVKEEKYKEAIKMLQGYRACKLLTQYKTILFSKAAKKYRDPKFSTECIDTYFFRLMNNKNFKLDQVKIDPHCTTTQVYIAVGDALTLKGNHKRAIEFYKIASELSDSKKDMKQSIQANYGLAHSYQKLNLMDQAEACFRKSIQINSADYQSYFVLAEFLYNQRKFQEALSFYQKFLSVVNPKQTKNYQDCLASIAFCWKELQNHQKQLQVLQNLMKIYDQRFNTLEELFQIYRPSQLVKLYFQLSSLYLQILSKNPNPQKFKDTMTKLILVYKVILQCTPGQYTICLDLAGCLHQMQNYQEALFYYIEFMKKANKRTQWVELNNCKSNMSLCYKSLGKQKQQLEILESMMKSYDDNYENLEALLSQYPAQELMKVYVELQRLYTNILKKNQNQKNSQQVKNKLILIYEVMLEFPNCQNASQIQSKINNLKGPSMAASIIS